jgi:hypothetical protein
MMSRYERRTVAWTLLVCTLVGSVWLASPAAVDFATPPSDEEDGGAQLPPLTEEIDERNEELDAPLLGRVFGLRRTIVTVRHHSEDGARPGHRMPLERPPRT